MANGKPQTKPKQESEYVVLAQDKDGAWSPIKSNGKIAYYTGQPGQKAIKLARARGDDSYFPGVYKAVPRSTWESDGNNLEILVETKEVTTFAKPGANGAAPAKQAQETPA